MAIQRDHTSASWTTPTAQRRPIDELRTQRLASAVRIVLFVVAGSLPVLSISAHAFGALSIDRAALYLVLPTSLIALVLACGKTQEARVFRFGVLAGMVAVTLYDSTRLPFIVTGIWADFIPNVGGWVINSDAPNAFLGYFWRYLGNGGGMGAVFVLACTLLGVRRHILPVAVGYGVFVWSGLMSTLVFSTDGQRLLFEITPLTFVVSLIGHLVYGAVLGWLYGWWVRRNDALRALTASDLAPVQWLRDTRVLRALGSGDR
jgi:hypothetical protein